MQNILLLPILAAIIQAALPQRFYSGLTTVLIAGCFAVLTYCFVNSVDRLQLVLQHSHPAMPLHFRIGSVWGNHEGSMLLWILLLSLPGAFLKTGAARQVTGWLLAGALLFLYFTANPFLPAVGDAFQKQFRGLNPLLQDIALIIHPPILYIGYTLAAVPFVYVVASGLEQQVDLKTVSKWMRPYINAAWSFLTLGIALGSWWAYRELGWGGWWFWDPVENASLVPWLLLTALMHSNISTAKFGLFARWTALLAVLAFSSAVLGMFLTRSGLLVSVHAFASDPTRGLVLFGYFCLILGLGLYNVCSPSLLQRKSKTIQLQHVQFWSRENFILLNNVMMMVSATIVLVATMWPLLDKDITIGAPFYNQAVVPIFLPVFLLMSLAILLPWRNRHTKLSPKNKQRFAIFVAVGVLVGLLFLQQGIVAFATAVVLASLLVSLCFINRQNKALLLGHTGIAVSVLGMLLVSVFSEQKIQALSEGDAIEINNKSFYLNNIMQGSKDNYIYREGIFKSNDKILNVQNRLYPNNRMNTVEVAILPKVFSHYYLVLGEKEENKLQQAADKYTVHLYYYPGIRLIWLGAVIMAIGGLWGVMLRLKR